MEIERGRHWRPRFIDRSTQTSIVILRRAWSFTRLEGCTPLIPVAVSFEGRATIVRHVHETLRLARPPQDNGSGSAVAGKPRITFDF
jgi:hypothetical protein